MVQGEGIGTPLEPCNELSPVVVADVDGIGLGGVVESEGASGARDVAYQPR